MSENIRQQNEGIVSWLRRLSARIDRLEKGDKGVRVNDSRLGDLVLVPNARTNQIETTNLKTGDVVPISGSREAVWSWPGSLSLGEGIAQNVSPPYCVPDVTVANQIVISCVDFHADVCVGVVFPNDFEIIHMIKFEETIAIQEINVPVARNDLIRLRLVGLGGNAYNVSVNVRFGEPSPTANNFPVNDCSFEL